MNKGLRWTWKFTVHTMLISSPIMGIMFYDAQGVNLLMAVYVLLIAQYDGPPFTNSDASVKFAPALRKSQFTITLCVQMAARLHQHGTCRLTFVFAHA